MSFILYLVVLVVSVTSVMMGLDWLSSPVPAIKPAVQTASAPTKTTPVKRVKMIAASGSGTIHQATAVAKTEPKPAAAQDGSAVAEPKAATSGTDALARADEIQASDDTANADDTSTKTAVAALPAPRCDVQACEMHYQSFRVSDCTYQPFDGPRRFCDIGHPPMRATPVVRTSDMRPAASSCNYQACASAYRSFDPGTCTYQPYDGPRRLCEK